MTVGPLLLDPLEVGQVGLQAWVDVLHDMDVHLARCRRDADPPTEVLPAVLPPGQFYDRGVLTVAPPPAR